MQEHGEGCKVRQGDIIPRAEVAKKGKKEPRSHGAMEKCLWNVGIELVLEMQA